jgi:competence protein ComEA
METPSWRQILGGTAGVALLGTIGYFGQAKIRTDSSPQKFSSAASKSKKNVANQDAGIANNAPTLPEGDFNMPPVAKKIKVDVSGEIAKPGVYELTEGERVEDLIKLAGGLKKDADRAGINLALKLKDEAKVVVPSKLSPKPQSATNSLISSPSKALPKNAGTTPQVADSGTQKVVSRSTKKQPPANPVSVNGASESELQSIPGIGPSMAQKIVAYRNTNGPFAAIEDLRKVKGMGEKLFDKIHEWITL